MKTRITFLLLSYLLPCLIFSQEAKTLDAAQPGAELEFLIQSQAIEMLALVRPFGKNIDTTFYIFNRTDFQFGKRLLIINEEKIYLDSVTQVSSLLHQNRKTLYLHSKDRIRHFYSEFKTNPNYLGLLESYKPDKDFTGQQAPDISGVTLSGETIHLNDLKGKVILLNFWFLKCGACLMEIKDLHKLKENYPELEIISVALDKKEALLKALDVLGQQHYQLKKPYDYHAKEILYRIIPDGASLIEKYEFVGYPANYFIDKQGFVQAAVHGYFSDGNYKELETALKKLLNQ